MISTQLLQIIFNCKCLVTDDVTNAQVGLSVIRLWVAISLKGQTLLNSTLMIFVIVKLAG